MSNQAKTEETELKTETRTTRFANWLMERETRRMEKESNLESLVKWNVLISFLTLAMVGGFEAAQTAVALIPYL